MLKRSIFAASLLYLSAGCAQSVTIVDDDVNAPPPPPATQPLGYYTDLVSAPVGAWVTAYGSGFGGSGTVTLNGNAQAIVSYSDTKVVFTVSGTGGALVVGGRSLGNLSVHRGRVIEVTPAGSLRSVINNLRPGDTVYLRAGTYSGKYDTEGWNEANFSLFRPGTAARPIALVAYPNESVTISNSNSRPNFHLGNSGGNRKTAYMSIAGFNLIAPSGCIDSGANTANSSTPESGAAHVRVVANTCTLTDATSNTMTGMFAVGGDDWKVLGNSFANPPNRVIINNNHGIYVQNGADDVEVAYNVLRNLRMGHVIQVHQDGTPMRYDNVWIHDNLIESANNMDTRGMTVSNVDSASTVVIERNTLRNLGQDFSGIAVYRGVATIRDNRFELVRAPNISLNGQIGDTRSVIATGNRFETVNGYPAVGIDNGASMSEITPTGNHYCALAAPAQETNPLPCN